MRLADRLEAMINDPVCEGTSMAGMIDLTSRGEIEASSNVANARLGGSRRSTRMRGLFS
jgi:1-aminocyclopropane-1-carboxylate deaminase